MIEIAVSAPLDLGAILRRLTEVSARPRYAFMVLNLISEAADETGRAGPTIVAGNRTLLLRDWLSEALVPLARGHRRDALRQRVAVELTAELPRDTVLEDGMLTAAVDERAHTSGKTNVSRAVGDLLRAGLVRRHYAGWRTNHHNRGGQRSAVYVLEAETLAALRRARC